MSQFGGVVPGFPDDSTSGPMCPTDNVDNNQDDFSNVLNLLEPPTRTSTDLLFNSVPGFAFDTDTVLNNFQDFTNDPGSAVAQAHQHPTFNSGFESAHAPIASGTGVNQSRQPGAAMDHQGFGFNSPLSAIPSAGGRTRRKPSGFSPSLVPNAGGNAHVQQYQGLAATASTSVATPLECTPFPDAVGPVTTNSFLRPAYVNLEVNRLAQPGPISHPDKNFRPYGTNNWHVILHDHTLLRYLSNSEIKEIRDHAGGLASASFATAGGQGEEEEEEEEDNQYAAGGGGRAGQPGLIGDGPYHTDDATQVWRYCQAYLSRRGQMRNNNAARRSRMKKESETRYWKMLALRAGVADHEYEFTEEEEEAAIARAEVEKAQNDEAAGDDGQYQQQHHPRKRNYHQRASNKGAPTGRGRGRGRRPAKKPAADSTSASLGAALMYGSPHGIPMSPPPPGQYYQVHAPAQQQQQQLYSHQPDSHVQQQTTQGQLPQHRFNTRSRTRAAAHASDATYEYDPLATTATAGGAGGDAGTQASSSQENQTNWMDIYLNM